MLNFIKSSSLIAAVGLTLSMMAGSAFADKPHWAEGNQSHKKYNSQQEKKHDKKSHDKKYDKRRRDDAYSYRFDRRDRELIYSYFGGQRYQTKCPPGLAKKNSHCLPPGQYKKWHRGQTLSKGVRYYQLPRELRRELPRPHDGYRYVRVDNDVLLIELATNVVVDVIENILRY